MKRWLSISLLLGVVLFCLPESSQAQLRFEFRLNGGWNSLDGGDLNTGPAGMLDYFRTMLNSLGYSATGEFSRAERGPYYGGDLIFWFAKNLGLGLGGSFLSASQTSVMDLSLHSLHLADFTFKVKTSAIPLRLGLYYDLPVSGRLSLSFHAALTYLLAQADFQLDVAGNWPSSTTNLSASGGGLGFQGGLGLKFALLRSVGIMAGVSGRVADLSGFEGKRTGTMTTEGRLYSYEVVSAWGNFPFLDISAEKPSSPTYANVREAKVSFNGFSLLIGLFLRL